ncbi:MAG: phosphatase PAP2 family protein [Clostridiales bacterium]|nr:phosphatase PAP2 family protein [Clostridiales bacterium]
MELNILNAIQNIRCDFLDKLMVAITSLGDAGIVWIVIAVILLFIKKYRKIGITIILAITFSLIFTNGIIKPLVDRERPFTYVNDIILLIATPTDSSFPSGHSSASFAAATAIFCWNKKYGICAYVLAGAIAFSRMYIFVHFPTDVGVGMILGIIYGIMAFFAVKKFLSIREERVNPKKNL